MPGLIKRSRWMILLALVSACVGAGVGADEEEVQFRDCRSTASCPPGSPGYPDIACTGYSGCPGIDGQGCKSWVPTAWDAAGNPTAGDVVPKCCWGPGTCNI
jgi:hypothetical protein